MSEIELLKKYAPEILDGYFGLIKILEKRCQLDNKVKELVLIGILVGKQSDHGLPIHVKRAKEYGVTDEEILTVIISALPSCGMGAVLNSLKIAREQLDLDSLLQ